MELAARKIMVTELAKFKLHVRMADITTENIYHQLCKLQDEWLDKNVNPELKSQTLAALRAAIHEQLNILENQ